MPIVKQNKEQNKLNRAKPTISNKRAKMELTEDRYEYHNMKVDVHHTVKTHKVAKIRCVHHRAEEDEVTVAIQHEPGSVSTRLTTRSQLIICNAIPTYNWEPSSLSMWDKDREHPFGRFLTLLD